MSAGPVELEYEDTTAGIGESGGVTMVEPFEPTKINIQAQQDSLSNLVARINFVERLSEDRPEELGSALRIALGVEV